MQMFYGPQGPTASAELNALTRGLPSSWATKTETLYNHLGRVDQLGAYGVWFDAAQLLAAAGWLGNEPEVNAFIRALEYVRDAARDKARGPG